jgi:uncharacterized protein (TIGR00725 family)
MKRRPVIAVIGDANIPLDDIRHAFAHLCGKLIIDSGWRLQTGGMGGVMEAACKGARSSKNWKDGDIIAILPGNDAGAANSFSDIILLTGLGHFRNMLVVQAYAVVAIGGGPGTLSELAFAWLSNKLVIAMRGPGWAGKLADTTLDERRTRLKKIANDVIYGVDNAEEAVKLLTELLPVYATCHFPKTR